MWFIRILITYCSKKALKYDSLCELLCKQDGMKILYAIGTMIQNREKWLKRVYWLCNISKW